MASEKNIREGGLLAFKSRCEEVRAVMLPPRSGGA